MAALSNKLENAFIDWFFRGQAIGLTGASAAALTGPGTLWFGLFTAAPTAAGGGTEVSGGNYARASVTSSLANWAGTQGPTTTVASTGTSGITSNNVPITFPAPNAAWGGVPIVAFGVFDALTGGNLLYFGTLASPKNVGATDAAPTFAIGAFQITFN